MFLPFISEFHYEGHALSLHLFGITIRLIALKLINFNIG
ncbi:MAG: hypothetical protein PWR20_14 [Bacteroidales bacterium]|jgi:hypothetical protein|nr:hypothetical protein [Bacteroidales bacterium]MDN5328589.1 hypothetical protein [Bacteroidales bacterium]